MSYKSGNAGPHSCRKNAEARENIQIEINKDYFQRQDKPRGLTVFI